MGAEAGRQASGQEEPLYREDFRDIGHIIDRDAEKIVARWYERAQRELSHSSNTRRKEMVNELVGQIRSLGERLQEQTGEFFEHPGAIAGRHGEARWHSGWDVADVVKDFQILHQVTLEHIGRTRSERLTYREAMVLSLVFDLSTEKSVEAFVQSVQERHEEVMSEIRRSNEDLQRFASIASHDLQAPLRMVSGFLNLLRERCEGQLDEKALRWLDCAVDGANHMSELLNGLLRYARAGSRGTEPVEVDPNDALDRALANLQPSVAQAGASIEREPLPTVRFDPTLLTQLFQNLISNAIKFSRPDQRPRVRISCRPRDGWWVFRVSDNGIGIPADQQDRIFDIFYRLDPSADSSGSGVGLAVCQRIVERHGGQIWVESEPGKGSTFQFTAPGVPHEQDPDPSDEQ